MDRMATHVNSERERLSLVKASQPPFEGRLLLVVEDDPPPRGSGQLAPMLLDEGTAGWLLEQLSTRFGEGWSYAALVKMTRAVWDLLDGREWDADTLAKVAEEVEAALGRTLAEPGGASVSPDGHLEAAFEDRVSGTEDWL